MARQTLGRHGHGRKPSQGRRPAARHARQRRPAVAPHQPSVGRGQRPADVLLRDRAAEGVGPRQADRSCRRVRARPARQRRIAAAAGQRAAGDGARLLAPAPHGDALPVAVPGVGRGGADRRRCDRQARGGQPGSDRPVRCRSDPPRVDGRRRLRRRGQDRRARRYWFGSSASGNTESTSATWSATAGPVRVSASLFRQEKTTHLLVRVSPVGGVGEGAEANAQARCCS